MSTPVHSGSKNPYVTGSISKSLLTPCRRVGLSRKRKTPASGVKTPGSSPFNYSPRPTETPTDGNLNVKSETPLSGLNQTLIDNRIKKSDEKGRTRLKKSVSKRLTMESENIEKEVEPVKISEQPIVVNMKESEPDSDSSDDLPLNIIKRKKVDVGPNNNNIKKEVNSSTRKNMTSNEVDSDSSNDTPIISFKRKIKNPIQSIDSVNLNVENKTIESNESDFTIETIARPKKYVIDSDDSDAFEFNTNSIKKTYSKNNESEKSKKSTSVNKTNMKTDSKIKSKHSLSIKKVSSVEMDIYCLKELEKSMAPCKVQVEKLGKDLIKNYTSEEKNELFSSTQNCLEPESPLQKAQHFKSIVEKQDFLKTAPIEEIIPHKPLIIMQTNYDEDNDFTCSPNEDKFNRKNTLENIKQLENSIKQKKELIANLKQAEVYKHKHNIEDLHKLTKVWTNGCQMALLDLLKQLQAHGPMDMSSLLNKLSIPNDVANKLNVLGN